MRGTRSDGAAFSAWDPQSPAFAPETTRVYQRFLQVSVHDVADKTQHGGICDPTVLVSSSQVIRLREKS